MTTKNIFLGFVIGVMIVAIAFMGGLLYYSERFPDSLAPLAVGSAGGTSFSSGKIAAKAVTDDGSTSTIASLYNGDDSDRFVTASFCYLRSITTAYDHSGSLIVKAATSSNATNIFGGGTATSTNLLANFVIATSSSASLNEGYVIQDLATSTGLTALSRIGQPILTSQNATNTIVRWPTTTYINFVADGVLASATAGICGVNYLQL